MLTLVIFLAILAILVLSHEFGHFIVARRHGIKVEEFGFGFPPRVFGIQIVRGESLRKVAESEEIKIHAETDASGAVTKEFVTDEKKEVDVLLSFRRVRFIRGNRELDEKDWGYGTVYSLNWLLPLGGFVKIKGENGEAESASDSFMSKKAWQKITVLAAGVGANIIMAALLLSAGYVIGLPQAVDDLSDVSAVKDRRLEIVEVLAGKPAAEAGLKDGDVILQVDNLAAPRLTAMQDYVDTQRDKEVTVRVRRNSEILEKKIKPVLFSDTGKAGIGVALTEVGIVQYPWYAAIYHGFVSAFAYLKEIVVAFYLLIKGLFTGAGVAGAVTGPVGIAVLTGKVARLGMSYLLQFTAVLSLNLAIVNILPLPALDGGRILFILINKLTGRPVPMKYEQLAHTLGFMALLLLVAVVTVHDLGNFKGAISNLINRVF